jgi:hypothetical protein
MSFTSTTNYALQKIGVNTEVDAWGDDVNSNMDIIDARMKLNADAAAAASTLAGTKAPLAHTHPFTEITGTATAAQLTDNSITNAKLTVMAINTLKGTNAGGPPLDLTGAQVQTMLGITGSVPIHSHVIADVTGLQTALDAAVKTEVGQAKSGSYTLVAGDAGTMITFNAAATVTVNASVMPANSRVDFINLGSGDVVFSGSATIRSSGSKLKLNGQYAGGTLWFISGSECVLVGDLKT